MADKITLMSEKFEIEQTGEEVEGITLIIDGALKQFLDIIKSKEPRYENNLAVIQEALMKGLESIKSDIKE